MTHVFPPSTESEEGGSDDGRRRGSDDEELEDEQGDEPEDADGDVPGSAGPAAAMSDRELLRERKRNVAARSRVVRGTVLPALDRLGSKGVGCVLITVAADSGRIASYTCAALPSSSLTSSFAPLNPD
jgi:hypothetical protein